MQLKDIICEVIPGEIVVYNGWEIPGEYKVLSFDLKSKYAEVLSWGSGDDCPSVILWANEGTLKTDKKLKNTPTKIKLKDYRGWNVLGVNVGRYTLTIFLEKRNDTNP